MLFGGSEFVVMALGPANLPNGTAIATVQLTLLYSVTVAASLRVKLTVGVSDVPGDVVVTLAEDMVGAKESLV